MPTSGSTSRDEDTIDTDTGSDSGGRIGRGLGRTVVSGLGWTAFGRIGALGLGLIANAFLARLLEPGAFGTYTLILSLTATGAMIAQVGLPQSAVRAMARANAWPDRAALRSVTVEVAGTTLIAATLGALVIASPAGGLLDRAFPRAHLDTVLGLTAAIAGLKVLENVAPELFRGVRDFRNASLFGGLLAALCLAGLAGAVYASDGRASLRNILWLTIASSAAPLALAALQLYRRSRSVPALAHRPRLFDRGLVVPSLWVGGVLNNVITQMDLWVVGALGTRREVAIYGAAFRLSTLVMLATTVANFVLAPLIVDLLERGHRERLQSLVQAVAVAAGGPALIILASFVAFGSFLSRTVYGPFYGQAGAALAILSLGKIVNVLTGPCAVTLVMAGGQRRNLRIVATNLVVTIPLQVAGYHLWDVEGVAAATAFGLAMQNLILLRAVRQLVGVRTEADPRQARKVLRDVRARGPLSSALRAAVQRRGQA